MTFSQFSFNQQLTSARVVSTTNLSGTYLNGPLNNGVGATLTATAAAALTIDSVAVQAGDRILLAGQTSASQNGVYVVNSAGSASSVWQLQRSDDQQSIEQFKLGQYLSISAGTANAGDMYVIIEPLPTRLGVDNLVYSSVAGSGAGVFLLASANLSDVASVSTARSNIGAQSAANLIAATTVGIGGGGAGPITVPVTGLVASSIVVATVKSSSNPVSVVAVTAANGSFNVTFSADPGAICFLYYIAFVVAQ